MNTYQKGNEPTVSEMEKFSERFSGEEWAKLITNKVFVSNYDKDLNTLALASEMILAGRYVGSLNDIK